MSIGAQTLNTSNINAIIGNWAVQLQDMFLQVPQFKSTLDAYGSSGLQIPTSSGGFGFSSGDAISLINAYNDLNALAQVYQGNDYIAAGASVNQGVPTVNTSGKFGYNFSLTIGKAAGIGF